MYNGTAGSGRSSHMVTCIIKELSNLHIEFTTFNLSWPPTLSNFTEAWVVGGDGTLHYFINFYKIIEIPVALFPGGTGNDTCWLLYGEQPIEKHIEIALSTTTKRMDIIDCNSVLTLNAAGIGFDGSVVKSLQGKKKRPGKTSYLLTVISKIFTYKSKSYTLFFNEKKLEGQFLFINICNGKRTGGGFMVAPMANPFDGQLDLILVKKLTIIKRLLNLNLIEKGKHLRLPFVQHQQVNHVIIESPQDMQMHLDGEYFSFKKAVISIAPAGLNVKVLLPD